MFKIKEYSEIVSSLQDNVTLVAVSKFHPVGDIQLAYYQGQKIFGESRPLELLEKYNTLPKDIQWHMIGQLQTNKIKHIAPFVALIHSVNSLKLAEAIDTQAQKIGRIIPVLLQIHVAQEATKQGFTCLELLQQIEELKKLKNIEIQGVMTMATYTDDQELISSEFRKTKELFDTIKEKHIPIIKTLSMGMSGDYKLAIEQGATMVRIGSAFFGQR
ncbi:MAG: YggS family pyridoxal phosphate-dependent enzyme [Rikenellaceae bacterium]